MIPVMCLVQEGQVPDDVASAIKASIHDFTQRTFDAKAEIDWIVVRNGSGFTASKPSTSLLASLHANRVLQKDERVALLKELCETCMNLTGLSTNEVVTSIRDPQ